MAMGGIGGGSDMMSQLQGLDSGKAADAIDKMSNKELEEIKQVIKQLLEMLKGGAGAGAGAGADNKGGGIDGGEKGGCKAEGEDATSLEDLAKMIDGEMGQREELGGNKAESGESPSLEDLSKMVDSEMGQREELGGNQVPGQGDGKGAQGFKDFKPEGGGAGGMALTANMK